MISLLKKIRPQKISQLIYVLHRTDNRLPPLETQFDLEHARIETEHQKGRTVTKLLIDTSLVYMSNTYFNVHFMKTIGEYGKPAIGGCFTEEAHRGLSIYPYMLQQVAVEVLKAHPKVFILVDEGNKPSIRGIEKAGFSPLCLIRTTRIGCFYFSIKKSTL